MNFRLLISFLIPFAFLNGNLLTDPKPLAPYHFIVVTLPKSGTHLLHKYLEIVQGRKQINITMALSLPSWSYFDHTKPEQLDQRLDRLKNSHTYLFSHGDLTQPVLRFLERHPDTRLIVNVRDLRDALVSQVYYAWDHLEKILGPSTAEEKLWFLLRHEDPYLNPHVHTMRKHAEAILPLLNHPRALVIHYEDFVGKNGGGTDELQLSLIFTLANHLQLSLSPEKALALQNTLYGNKGKISATFRSGKIGEWKTVFSKEQLDYFNSTFGKLQLDFGYSIE